MRNVSFFEKRTRRATTVVLKRQFLRPTLSRLQLSRMSHSASQPSSHLSNNEQTFRLQVLEASLHHVPLHGWTSDALVRGVQDVGLPSVSHGIFARGAVELVEYFMERANQDMSLKVEAQPEIFSSDGKDSSEEKLKAAIQIRLRILQPYISTWSQAMALGLLPVNLPTTLRNLALLSDDLCYIAGYRDTDLNWYKKRSTVAIAYTASEVYMLTDTSPDFTDTWDFVHRRVSDDSLLMEPQDTLAAMRAATDSMANAASSIVSESPLSSPGTAFEAATRNPKQHLDDLATKIRGGFEGGDLVDRMKKDASETHTALEALLAEVSRGKMPDTSTGEKLAASTVNLIAGIVGNALPKGYPSQLHENQTYSASTEDDPGSISDDDRDEFAPKEGHFDSTTQKASDMRTETSISGEREKPDSHAPLK